MAMAARNKKFYFKKNPIYFDSITQKVFTAENVLIQTTNFAAQFATSWAPPSANAVPLVLLRYRHTAHVRSTVGAVGSLLD